MYYILLLSQMSKLQFCLESNNAAVFQLNLLPGKILFFLIFRLGFYFFWKLGNRRIFWIGNGAYIRPLVIGRKGPDNALYKRFNVGHFLKVPYLMLVILNGHVS